MEIRTIACILFLISFNTNSCDALVGGEDAKTGEFLHVVSLRNFLNEHYCGGALITRRQVVTAAQCLYTDESVFEGIIEVKYEPEDVKVLVGTVYADISNLTTHQRQNLIFAVRKLTPHPNFNVRDINTMPYDIAVITLDKEVNTNEATPIKLPNQGIAPKLIGTVAGWGNKYVKDLPTFTVSPKLQKLTFTISPIEDCKKVYVQKRNGNMVSKSLDNKSIYCAMGGKNTGLCMRDGGNPMMSNGVLIGIASFGIPCATGAPDVFISVAYHKDFINKQIEL